MSSHHHNSGSLKQTNKKHKGKAGSKRALKLAQGGKVQQLQTAKAGSHHDEIASLRSSKLARVNQANQARKLKKLDVLLQKRLGSNHGPPRIVALIPITDAANTTDFWTAISSNTDKLFKPDGISTVTYASFPNFKAKCIFMEPQSRDLLACLEICKIADAAVLMSKECMGSSDLLDETAINFLSCMRSVGSPELIGIIQNSSNSDSRQQQNSRIALQKYLHNNFQADCKVFDDSHVQSNLFCRHLTTSSIRHVSWKETRSYLISDNMAVTSQSPNADSNCIVKFSGYLRGRPLLADSLIHISSVGTCRLLKIESAVDPFTASKLKGRTGASKPTEPSTYVKFSDISKQDSMVLEANHDGISGEQTWPTEEEMEMAVASDTRSSSTRKIPKGMSAYQADWLVGDDGEWNEGRVDDDDDDDDDGDDDGDDNFEDGDDDEMVDEDSAHHVADHDDDDNESLDNIDDDATVKPENKFGGGRSKHQMSEDDKEFPDEVDTPEDMAARERFARYRALQSFRSSPWHPKENLPIDYAKIFQFENFAGAQRRILERSAEAEKKQQDMILGKGHRNASMSVDEESSGFLVVGSEDHVCSDQYVSLYLELSIDQLALAEQSLQTLGVCSLFSLLKHENKLSVLHFKIQRTEEYAEPIKAKEDLIFQVGFRTFAAKPIFSEANLNSDKHKSERFLRHGGFSVASVYGPITFAPCPVLIFKDLGDGCKVLVATGGLMNVDPDRIVLKRVILTGHPIRVRKKTAVVKHMFYDPMDVRWFKPAELATKWGMRGHITDSVGTHGLFKAQFNAPVKQNDTIMLVLYKRVFPKFPAGGVAVK